jgi:hypothetical protein
LSEFLSCPKDLRFGMSTRRKQSRLSCLIMAAEVGSSGWKLAFRVANLQDRYLDGRRAAGPARTQPCSPSLRLAAAGSQCVEAKRVRSLALRTGLCRPTLLPTLGRATSRHRSGPVAPGYSRLPACPSRPEGRRKDHSARAIAEALPARSAGAAAPLFSGERAAPGHGGSDRLVSRELVE